ncbi:coproporphyrinogen III oxidase [Paenibacillus sp. MSJ-34]|uniref:coproporphyrinogen III oxidase n=1 Tax=Paenibacillus sp. MSJ-34 TaxID=2841529 RepID=UPI001C10A045|nr:coproporphyrinogen III oxidase [Paenibacillus sp. MSJ-34]MBU5442628.1 coproporphyrinogen III oxidase [Paenibacillus sp. MSJ-34]
MRIDIVTRESAFERTFSNIVHLFFEEAEVNVVTPEHTNDSEKSDMTIALMYERTGGGRLEAAAALDVEAERRRFTASHTRTTEAKEDDEAVRKHVKQAMCHVLLHVLQQYTGIVQPWGILTGIRPTKLLHGALQQGLSKENAHRTLREQYLVDRGKIELMQQIVDRQLTMIPDLYALKNEVSIYIGIPFCPTKCAYCTFPAYDINGRQGSVHSFLGGLHYEMREIGRWLRERGISVTTVYFGGGTPTSITAEEMDMLYEELHSSFPYADRIREITVEAGRPDTITPEKLAVLNKWNIDRISINPQSYTQETLDIIGRHHSVEETVDKFWLAREAGMNNINMDLIIGLPGEGIAEFKHTLAETEKLMPESLTVHTLSFKKASEMTKHRGDGKYTVAGRSEIESMMREAERWTKLHGYVPYYLYRQKNILGNLENVGYAIPGQESLYNILIMEEMQTIIGLGCGAASKWVDPSTGAISRFANPKEPKAYNDNYEHYTKAKIEILEQLFGTKS